MSFGDLTELLDILEELNITIHDENESVSHVETELCPYSFSLNAVLYSMSVM